MQNELNKLNEMKVDRAQYEACRKKLHEIDRNDIIRVIAAGELLINNLFYAIKHIYYIQIPISLILLGSVLIWILLFIMSEKPKLWLIIAGLLFLGLITRCIAIENILLLSVILYWNIRDNQNMQWLKNQPGYPKFSVILDEKKRDADKEYQPEHHFDNIHDGEIPEIDIPERSDFYAD